MSYQMAYQNVISYVVPDVCSDIYNVSKLIVIHLAHLLTKLEAKSWLETGLGNGKQEPKWVPHKNHSNSHQTPHIGYQDLL